MTKKKKLILSSVVILLISLIIFFFFVPTYVGKSMNSTLTPPPYKASDKSKALHERLFIADMHADTLMWNRNLLKRGSWGHVDVPRLIEGNVAIQVFSVVTQSPRNLNIESNSGDTDNITLLAIADRWPMSSWWNLTERAVYQANKLQGTAELSNGTLTILKTKTDIINFLEQRKRDKKKVAAILAIEGAHALSGDINNLDKLYDAGFRIIGLAHFFDNEMAGSAHGVNRYGLTDKGKELIKRMEEKKILIDLAHVSPNSILDVLAVAKRPVIVSHTGVKRTCDNTRNLSDSQIKAISLNGGVIGIGYWDTATCGNDAGAIARAIRHTVNIAGIDHVALGSDFDGAIVAPFDTTGIVQITDALMKEGFTEAEIRKIMGENFLRVLQTNF